MSHEIIKVFFSDAVSQVASNISQYTINPGKDLTRTKKMGPEAPSASAFNQQRAKLKPEALEEVFHRFNSSVLSADKTSGYRFPAADGSSFTYFSKPSFSSSEYFVSEGHYAKGFFSMHLNAFYDLQKHTYTDALIQPVHHKDEFKALCEMVDLHTTMPDVKDVFIGETYLLEFLLISLL